LNIGNKISPLPIGQWRYSSKPWIGLHLRNSNKQHLILAKFCINNASFIANLIAKFQLNLPTQTIVIAAHPKTWNVPY